jgi:cyclic pyranopterin phosphate synthase
MYLRVSVTDRCNLRCRYCLPEGARFAPDSADSSELFALTRLVHAAVGVHKIRLTGGEPTLNPDLPAFVAMARAIAPVVGLTSNGVLLEPLLPALRDAGLNRLNISLDAVDADGFRRSARRDGLERVLAAIAAARRVGFSPVKINTVAMGDTDYAAMVRFAAFAGVHLRFIELMAIGEARPWQATEYVSSTAIRERLYGAGISLAERTDRDEPTSRVWQIDDHPVEDCSVGFITTVSAPFCATCDRLRLSSRGRLFTCLMDNTGHDLLTPLRAGDEAEVIARVRAAVAGKRPPAVFQRYESMAAIGG